MPHPILKAPWFDLTSTPVWSWCAAEDPACAGSSGPMRGNASSGARLEGGDNTTHVLVEARRAAAEGPSAKHPWPSSPAAFADGALLEVRSTFASAWQPLPAAATRAAFATAATPASAATAGGILPLSVPLSLPLGMWALRDVCVGYGPATPVQPSIYNDVSKAGLFADRRMLLVQAARPASAAEPTHRGGGGAPPPRLLWPLRWPRHYNDGDARPFRSEPYGAQDAFFADVARAHAWTHDQALRNCSSDAERRRWANDPWTSTPLQARWVDSPAVVVESTLDNLFHTLFHALALREDVLGLHDPLVAAARRLLRQAGRPSTEPGSERSGTPSVEWLPRYTVLWPAGGSSDRWLGWELTTRALAASLSGVEPPPAAAVDAMLAPPLSLRCYPLVLGGHAPFWPELHMPPRESDVVGLLAARPRLEAFRRALWRSVRSRGSLHLPDATSAGLAAAAAPAPATAAAASVLFVSRRGARVRAIDNEEDLVRAIEGDPRLAGRVRFLALEASPLVEQLAAVSAASVLAGVHGMGMAWVAMMGTAAGSHAAERPAQHATAAALEIFPQQMLRQRTHAWLDYRRWAFMSGVDYFLLVQPDVPACRNLDFRRCGNVSVVPGQVSDALARVLQHSQHARGPSRARMTADPAKSWRIRGLAASLECANEREGSLCAMRWMPTQVHSSR